MFFDQGGKFLPWAKMAKWIPLNTVFEYRSNDLGQGNTIKFEKYKKLKIKLNKTFKISTS